MPAGLLRWIVVALAALLIFWNLGESSLHTWDEAGHSLVAREILDTGDWLTLRITGVPYFKKGPLKFWLTAATFRLAGVSEWTVRFWSALAALATVAALVFLGDALYGGRAGTWAGLILVTGHQYLYKHCARTGDVDSYLILFWTVGLLLTALAAERRSPRLLLLAGLSIGLSGLAKHLGMVPQVLAIAGLWAGVSGAWRHFRPAAWAGFAGVAVLMVAPWTASQLWLHGAAFVESHFGREVLTRAASGLPGTPESRLGILFGPVTLKNGMFPWSLLVPFALVAGIGGGAAGRRRNLLLYVWIATVVLGVSLTAGKAYRYMLPAYPALALLVGQLLDRLRRSDALAVGGALVAAWAALFSTTTALEHNPFVIGQRKEMIEVDLLGRLPGGGWAVLAAALAAGAAIALWRARRRRWAAAAPAVALGALALFVVAAPLRISDRRHAFDLAVGEARRLQAAGDEIWVALPPAFVKPPFYGFYLRLMEPGARLLQPHPQKLARRLTSGEGVVVLTYPKVVRGLLRETPLRRTAAVSVDSRHGRFVLLRVEPRSPRAGRKGHAERPAGRRPRPAT